MGFVRRLILALSKKSNLLAHQLIWNIRTNTFKNEDTPDNEMQAKLEPIARQIEIDFTHDARNFYERVFAFSDRLTKVSDTIKIYPKGNARKEGKISTNNKINLYFYIFQLVYMNYERSVVKFHLVFIFHQILKLLLFH
jgi:phosphatidylinositol 4-kinase